MSVEMVCERKEGICNLCGADPEEDCPLTDLAPELAEWSEGPVVTISVINEPGTISDNDECESCQ